jgi:hypothetical protein
VDTCSHHQFFDPFPIRISIFLAKMLERLSHSDWRSSMERNNGLDKFAAAELNDFWLTADDTMPFSCAINLFHRGCSSRRTGRDRAQLLRQALSLQIPMHRGHLLRFDRGQATDLMAATIPM